MLVFKRYKLNLALSAMRLVFADWRYVLLAGLLAVVFIELIYWLRNLSLLWYLFTSFDVDIPGKISLLVSAFTAMFRSGETLLGAMLLAVGAVQGVALALLVFIYRNQTRASKKAVGGSALASLSALLGLGCVACGTSLVMPILGLFSSSVSITAAEIVGSVVAAAALVFAMYSLYELAYTAYPGATERYRRPE